MYAKFIETQSKWGNLYRRRYYVDGKRVAGWDFDAKFNAMNKTSGGYARTVEDTAYGFRTVWKF